MRRRAEGEGAQGRSAAYANVVSSQSTGNLSGAFGTRWGVIGSFVGLSGVFFMCCVFLCCVVLEGGRFVTSQFGTLTESAGTISNS